MSDDLNAAELASLKNATEQARQAGVLKEWPLPNGINANIFPVSEIDEDRGVKKPGIGIVITPTAETVGPRKALTDIIEHIKKILPEGLTIPKDRDIHYLSNKGEGHDTGAIFIDLGTMTPSIAMEELNSLLQKMVDPERIAIEHLKRGSQRGK